MPTPGMLETLAKRVEGACSLDELRMALITFQEEVEHHDDFADDVEGALGQCIDVDNLPTFGCEPPKNLDGVRSWDEDRLLVGSGSFWDLEFVERFQITDHIFFSSASDYYRWKVRAVRRAQSSRWKPDAPRC
jgi:hypothetical protein